MKWEHENIVIQNKARSCIKGISGRWPDLLELSVFQSQVTEVITVFGQSSI